MVGLGGDNASLRGIRFTVEEAFVSIELGMDATSAGTFTFSAELRRSNGFVGPVEATSMVTVDLPGTPGTVPFPAVHIDFPEIPVSGPETFTLKFLDFIGPGSVFFEVAGLGNFPCPDVEVTDENDVADPTERTDPTGFRVLALGQGTQFLRGDADASGSVAGIVDGVFLLTFQFVPGSPAPPCMSAADADDSGSVNGLVDGLYVLNFQFVPGSPPPPDPGPTACGPDPTDDPLVCETYLTCP